MKIIDLLNKIANGEEVPKKIKLHNLVLKKFDYSIGDGTTIPSYCNEKEDTFLNDFLYSQYLNDEVEILEEKKKPEKISPLSASDILDIIGTKYTKAQDKALQNLFEHIRNQDKKINEIIDCLDYLKSKGDE